LLRTAMSKGALGFSDRKKISGPFLKEGLAPGSRGSKKWMGTLFPIAARQDTPPLLPLAIALGFRVRAGGVGTWARLPATRVGSLLGGGALRALTDFFSSRRGVVGSAESQGDHAEDYSRQFARREQHARRQAEGGTLRGLPGRWDMPPPLLQSPPAPRRRSGSRFDLAAAGPSLGLEPPVFSASRFRYPSLPSSAVPT
jgi:hypothetical protein